MAQGFICGNTPEIYPVKAFWYHQHEGETDELLNDLAFLNELYKTAVQLANYDFMEDRTYRSDYEAVKDMTPYQIKKHVKKYLEEHVDECV